MLYLEYHELSKKCRNAETDYYNALDKRCKLISSVFPGAVKPKEIIAHSSTSPDAKIVAYASEIEEIDKLVNTSRNTMDMLKYELDNKEKELRSSNDIYDKIYVYKWIEHISVYRFYKQLGYSVRQIYNLISEMKKKIYKK